jgi:hypothetical protein
MTAAAQSFELIVSPNRVYEEGRRCCERGCITILSRYNPCADCFVHQDERLARERERAAELRRRAA